MTNQVLGKRYEIQQQLGRNAGRRTLLARDLQTQELVIIKLLAFGNEFEWDNLKLFEREAETLRSLSHPAIPRYLDSFELDSSDSLNSKGFALVQTYIEGRSLEEHLQAGRTFSEAEVRQIAQTLLDILIYLHERQPSVIHRDIKPSNLMLSNRFGHLVGDVYLVDFGSVQTLAAREGKTFTVVGTYGYMPPEQFGGRTVPASDLYSLGATLITLVTGAHPADLPQKEGRIQFEQSAHLGPAFTRWLKRMIEPNLDRRFASARSALQALEQPESEPVALAVSKPAGSKILMTKDPERLEVLIPPMGFHPALIFLSVFAIAWNSFILFWTTATLAAPFPINLAFGLFSLPFWAAGGSMVIAILFSLFGKVRLRLDQQQIALIWELFGVKFHRPRPAPRHHINKLVYIPKHFTKDSEGSQIQVLPQVVVWAGVQKYELGGNGINGSGVSGSTEPEIQWLAHELSDWLELPIMRE